MDNCDVYNAPKKTVGMSGEIRIYFSMCEKTDEALQCRKNEKIILGANGSALLHSVTVLLHICFWKKIDMFFILF